MKRNLIIGSICILTGLYSCDYISNPVPSTGPDNNGKDCPDVTFPANTKPHRIVLLEDYTGHKCTSCPQAAIMATKMEEQFKDSLVVMAVHSGAFAVTDKQYPEDFTTAAGDEYQAVFKFGGWPNGLVNRVDFLKNKHVKSYGSWGAEISKQLQLPAEADIQMKSEYNAADSNACISVQTTFLSASIPDGEYYLSVLLIQDHIIAPQKDGTVYVTNYEHNHVLRDNITSGGWGDVLLTGPVILTPISKKFKYKVKPSYKSLPCIPKDCHLIAFVYEKTSKRILQAAKIHLTQ